MPKKLTEWFSFRRKDKDEEPRNKSRRSFLKLVVLTALHGCMPKALKQKNGSPIVASNETPLSSEVLLPPEELILRQQSILLELVHDPLVMGSFSTTESELNPWLMFVSAEMARAGAHIIFKSLSGNELDAFKQEILPRLPSNVGVDLENIGQVLIPVKENSSMGGVYKIVTTDTQRTFYLRFTPSSNQHAVNSAVRGLGLQRNFLNQAGATGKVVARIEGIIPDPNGIESVVTIVEGLGANLDDVVRQGRIKPERLNSALTSYFTDHLVPNIRNGLFKRDISGGGEANIVLDESFFAQTGEIKFYHVDFAERPTVHYIPEAAIHDNYLQLQKLVERLNLRYSQAGVASQMQLPALETLMSSHPSFSGLQTNLLTSKPAIINTYTQSGDRIRVIVPQKVLDALSDAPTSNYLKDHLKHAITYAADQGGIQTLDGQRYTFIKNSFTLTKSLKSSAMKLLRPAALWAGRAMVVLDIMGLALTADNLINKMLFENTYGLSLENGNNSFTLDALYVRSQAVKENRLSEGQALPDAQLPTPEQFSILEELGLDHSQIIERLAAQDGLPIGLINEGVVDGVAFDVAQGQKLEPLVYYTTFEDEFGTKSMIWYYYPIINASTEAITHSQRLKPLLALQKQPGQNWRLHSDLTTTFHDDDPEGYTEEQLGFQGRQGNRPPNVTGKILTLPEQGITSITIKANELTEP